jgi:hypothetical protein
VEHGGENLVEADKRRADPRLRGVLRSMLWRGVLYGVMKPRASGALSRL